MENADDSSPIGDDELLYRRIPVSMGWYDPAIEPLPSPFAFGPRPDDDTGLSVVRGHPFNTAEQAARGPSKKGYFVAVVRAGDLRANGFDIEPRPIAGVAGHAEITSLTVANRDTDEAKSMMVKLAHVLCLRVEGPFKTTE